MWMAVRGISPPPNFVAPSLGISPIGHLVVSPARFSIITHRLRCSKAMLAVRRQAFAVRLNKSVLLGQLDDIVEHYEDFKRGLVKPTGPASQRGCSVSLRAHPRRAPRSAGPYR